MSTPQDPRDAAIIALRAALLESRQNISANAKQIDAVLQETEQIAREVSSRMQSSTQQEEYNLADLRGLGAKLWHQELNGRDAQDYVSMMRDEWDEREQQMRQGLSK